MRGHVFKNWFDDWAIQVSRDYMAFDLTDVDSVLARLCANDTHAHTVAEQGWVNG